MKSIAFLAWSAVAAQTPTGPAAQPVSLSGSVVNAITGEPVKKARVMLQVNSVRGSFSGPTNASTDLSGRFTFSQIPPGSYGLRAEHANYPQRRQSMAVETLTSVVLTEGQSKSDVTIKLIPGSAITGRVTNEEGEPMSHCSVQLMERRWENGRAVLGGMNGASTNERGEYRLFNIPAGRYYLQSRCMRAIPQPHPLRPREAVSQAALSYPILFYPNSTAQEGAARIAVEPGTDVQGIDFRFTPIRSVSVSGRVVFPAGSSIPGMSIHLLRRNANGDVDSTPVSWASARPDNGRFTLTNVAPGSFVLQAGMYGREQILYARETLEVGENPIADLTIHLKPSLELKATVDVEKASQPAQVTAPPMEQQHLRINPMEMRMQMGSANVRREPDGSFLIQRLTPGKWEISTSMGYVKSVRLGDRETATGVIEITGGEGGEIKIVVSQRYGSVSGTVQGSSPGQQVTAVLLPDGYTTRSHRVHPLMMNPNGQLQGPAAPGRYRVIAIAGMDAYRLTEPALAKFVARHAASVTVEAEGQVSVVVPLVSREAMEQAYREAMEEQP